MAEESLDLSGAVEMLKTMLAGEEGQQQIQNIMGMFQSDDPEKKVSGIPFGGQETENLEMMMKIQRAMELMNRQKENNQAKLLAALRPFLKPERKEKVDSAMKLLRLTGLIEMMQEVQEE